jgi:ribonucleoside-diphosphate reductase alpha chain
MEQTFDETIQQEKFSINTIFTDEFSKEIYEQTYMYGDEDINKTQLRVAKDLARIEKDKDYWTQQFLWLQENFRFVPGGRITSNAGTGLKGTTYINCFVDGFMGEDQDSLLGIMQALQRQAMILKSEGGYGICADVMRPRGAFVFGIGNESPGSVDMLDMWDTQSAVITKGSGQKTKNKQGKVKIRKGAQMVTMSVWHPDVEEFITAKLTAGRLTKFNMSVLATDEFMDAVEHSKPWNLEFPDYEKHKEEYKQYWNGNLKEWKSRGLGTTIFKTFDDANELWDVIMKSTYNRNEPGVLFVDTMNRLNNLYYNEYISATNPCVTQDAWIMTDKGPRQAKDLIGVPFNAVVNGAVFPSTDRGFFKTGDKTVYEISTSKGFRIRLTDNHPMKKVIEQTRHIKNTDWVEVKDLKIGDNIVLSNHREFNDWSGEGNREQGWLVGSLLGDGNFNKEMGILSYWGDNKNSLHYYASVCVKNNFAYGKTFGSAGTNTVDVLERNKKQLSNKELKTYVNRFFSTDKFLGEEIEITSSEFYKGFLAGLFDADGSIQGTTEKGVSIRLSSSRLDQLRVVQRMLSRLGIISTIYPNRRDAGVRNIGRHEYFCQAQHELVIANDNIIVFNDKIRLVDIVKQGKLDELLSTYKRTPNRERFVDEIIEINKIGIADVYDCTIPAAHEFDANGFNVHNCGEQILPIGGVCLLGSINLTQFVNFKKKDWDYEGLAKVIPIAVRFMDNVNDITYVPLELQKQNLKDKRRIGLGIMGYGSALMMMKVRYGSEKAIELTDKLYSFFANTAYKASALLAEEKGAFGLFDKDKYLAGNFVKVLEPSTRKLIERNGLRNSHLLSIQPTGNSSVFANNVSGGLEPVFLPEYIRTAIMPYAPEGLDKPKNINWDSKTFESNTEWLWIKEGDENLLKTSFGGYTWKFDKNRGLLRETIVQDYSVRYLTEKGEWDSSAEWAATTTQLSIDEHVKTMAVMAKYIDSAMSKTVNLPNDYPFEDFKRLYMDCYKTGVIKGATTYRAGTMTSVLSSTDKNDDENSIKKTNAPKRAKTLDCDIHNVSVAGEKWLVLVGLLGKDPYEVFAFKKTKGITLADKLKHGKLTRVKSGHYDLTIGDGDVQLENIGELFETDEQEALTRMISNSLRHGSDIKHIYTQLQKSQGNILSFSKAIARTLKKYLTEVVDSEKKCESCGDPEGIILQEGCYKCKSCGHSRC